MSRQVFTGDPRWTLVDAAARMRADRVGALVVMGEDGLIAGIITERDLMRAIAEGRDPGASHVSEYMTQEPLTIDAGEEADRAAGLMVKHRIRHLPVLQGGRLVGLLSVRDILALHPWPKQIVIGEPW